LGEKSRSRAKLLLLIGFLALPVIGATVVYRYCPPESTSNYGELLPPEPLPEVALLTTEKEEFRLSDLRGKWVMLTADSGNCDEHCRQKLYKMRQLRLTQGEDRERIARVWLITDSIDPAPELAREYAGTWFVRADNIVQHLPAETDFRDHIYLVDNKGNLMMRYPKDADATRMVKDLKRLLRLSGR
jgi:cytochrome oxidase Cu insertion factor (SCO1/SenC/PrrC family)